MPLLRCKLRVTDVTRRIQSNGETESEHVKLQAVYGDKGTENGEWSRWTPSANFEISITNPSAFGALSRDFEFFVDFTPATNKE
jgi:hypothetical protein